MPVNRSSYRRLSATVGASRFAGRPRPRGRSALRHKCGARSERSQAAGQRGSCAELVRTAGFKGKIAAARFERAARRRVVHTPCFDHPAKLTDRDLFESRRTSIDTVRQGAFWIAISDITDQRQDLFHLVS